MPTVKIETSVDAGVLLQVQVDRKKVTLDASGEAVITIATGKYYALRWFVMGDAGSKYSVAVTSPKALKFQSAATLDIYEKDMGQQWLYLD